MNFVEQLECLEKLESLILKKAAMLAGSYGIKGGI